MANKSRSKTKPNQKLKQLRALLKQSVVAIDKIQVTDTDHCKDEEILFHIAIYLRQLHHRGLHFISTHGISYL
jgi:hypothetical protein